MHKIYATGNADERALADWMERLNMVRQSLNGDE